MAMSKTQMKLIGVVHTALYKASGGRLGRNMRGSEVVLLTTTGRTSGKRRTSPLFGRADGDSWVVIASNGGHPEHPTWYLNLRDNPDVELQVGAETTRRRAETVDGDERTRLWKKMAETYANYDDYQASTSRVIPVVLLRPAG